MARMAQRTGQVDAAGIRTGTGGSSVPTAVAVELFGRWASPKVQVQWPVCEHNTQNAN